MRDLEECTAEVFRRGEKRIKEHRRNRNRVLAACIPVCLITTVWAVIVFPGMMPAAGTSDLAQAAEEINGNAGGSPACPYTAVEIQQAGLFPEERCGEVTDQPAVAEMFQAIQSLFADADGNDQVDSEIIPAAEDNANRNLTDGAIEAVGRTITFTAEDGLQTVYILSENTLMDVSANKTVFLSDDQAAGLMAALGLAE